MKQSTRKKLIVTRELFDKICGILKEKGKMPDILDYGLATHCTISICFVISVFMLAFLLVINLHPYSSPGSYTHNQKT